MIPKEVEKNILSFGYKRIKDLNHMVVFLTVTENGCVDSALAVVLQQRLDDSEFYIKIRPRISNRNCQREKYSI